MSEERQTEYDTITLGIQPLSMSAEIFRLESDFDFYSLEYEIVSIDFKIFFFSFFSNMKENSYE